MPESQKTKPALKIGGQPLGQVFGRLVHDIAEARVPSEFVPAVDVKVTMRMSTDNKKGFDFIFTNTTSEQSSITVELATRVHRSAVPGLPDPEVHTLRPVPDNG